MAELNRVSRGAVESADPNFFRQLKWNIPWEWQRLAEPLDFPWLAEVLGRTLPGSNLVVAATILLISLSWRRRDCGQEWAEVVARVNTEENLERKGNALPDASIVATPTSQPISLPMVWKSERWAGWRLDGNVPRSSPRQSPENPAGLHGAVASATGAWLEVPSRLLDAAGHAGVVRLDEPGRCSYDGSVFRHRFIMENALRSFSFRFLGGSVAGLPMMV